VAGRSAELPVGAAESGTPVELHCRTGKATVAAADGAVVLPGPLTQDEGCGLLMVRVGGRESGFEAVAVVDDEALAGELNGVGRALASAGAPRHTRQRLCADVAWLLEASEEGWLEHGHGDTLETARAVCTGLLAVAWRYRLPVLAARCYCVAQAQREYDGTELVDQARLYDLQAAALRELADRGRAAPEGWEAMLPRWTWSAGFDDDSMEKAYEVYSSTIVVSVVPNAVIFLVFAVICNNLTMDRALSDVDPATGRFAYYAAHLRNVGCMSFLISTPWLKRLAGLSKGSARKWRRGLFSVSAACALLTHLCLSTVWIAKFSPTRLAAFLVGCPLFAGPWVKVHSRHIALILSMWLPWYPVLLACGFRPDQSHRVGGSVHAFFVLSQLSVLAVTAVSGVLTERYDRRQFLLQRLRNRAKAD